MRIVTILALGAMFTLLVLFAFTISFDHEDHNHSAEAENAFLLCNSIVFFLEDTLYLVIMILMACTGYQICVKLKAINQQQESSASMYVNETARKKFFDLIEYREKVSRHMM